MTVSFMRPVRGDDFEQIHALAMQTGGGMTNLPMDRKALKARVEFILECFEKNTTEASGENYMLVLEREGQVLGTAAIFSAIGLESGFVNYRINTMFHFSEQLGKRVSRRLLVPTHDFTGSSEVASLFISPKARGGGFGKLLARSRYLFMAQTPHIFADRVCAELRGWRTPDGGQPFWKAVGQHFFDMEFEEADQHNSIAGNQFIADLMPIYPIYMAVLPEAARACIGRPHESGEAAFNMLLNEGFEYRGYVDIFDGGPVVDARIQDIRTVRKEGQDLLIAAGERIDFRCVRSTGVLKDNHLLLSSVAAKALNVDTGSIVRITQS